MTKNVASGLSKFAGKARNLHQQGLITVKYTLNSRPNIELGQCQQGTNKLAFFSEHQMEKSLYKIDT
jgi:hypothetical protein